MNVDNDTLRRILDNPEAMAAVERIEGWRALGDNIIETIINKSDKVKELKKKGQNTDLTSKEPMRLSPHIQAAQPIRPFRGVLSPP